MTPTTKNIAVLGSTGSIGRNTLAVVRQLQGFRIWGLSGHSNLTQLADQVREFAPAAVACTARTDGTVRDLFDRTETPMAWTGRLMWGPQGLVELASAPEVDIVVAAIVGRAGLESTLAAVHAGKRVALANKEALVVGGQVVIEAARRSGAQLVPVDSEHSAIWQCLAGGRRDEVRRVILTASGGPFRNWDRQQLQQVKVDEALAHPNWRMGPKITIDSATMMNKALEMIEARWLFDLEPHQIEVVIHPQSIVHSLVEFVDGSVLAQCSPPDMKLPIQYALTYPQRMPGPVRTLDWTSAWKLDLNPPNAWQCEALELGRLVCQRGGTSGAVLNATNEVAVQAFLEGRISFAEIVPSCREILEQHQTNPTPTYQQLIEADAWARQEMNQWILA